MERIAKPYRKTYRMLRVYKDDLERIVVIIKENCGKVTIKAEEFKLSDIADLNELREKSHLETLSLFGVDGWEHVLGTFDATLLSVDLKQGDSPSLYLSDASNTKLYGAAMQIDAILSARSNTTLDTVTSSWAILLGTLVCFAVAIFGMNQPWKLHPNPSPDAIPWISVIIGCLVLAFALPLITSRIRTQYALTVDLEDSHSHKRLTREQRKQLLNGSVGFALGVLSTVIGGLIVWALTH